MSTARRRLQRAGGVLGGVGWPDYPVPSPQQLVAVRHTALQNKGPSRQPPAPAFARACSHSTPRPRCHAVVFTILGAWPRVCWRSCWSAWASRCRPHRHQAGSTSPFSGTATTCTYPVRCSDRVWLPLLPLRCLAPPCTTHWPTERALSAPFLDKLTSHRTGKAGAACGCAYSLNMRLAHRIGAMHHSSSRARAQHTRSPLLPVQATHHISRTGTLSRACAPPMTTSRRPRSPR